MTDNEIKKALQNAINEGDAPIGERFGCVISKSTAKEILDFINRQQAEIERLKAEKTIACSLIPVRGCGKIETKMKMFSQTVESIENAAIKEFIKKLKEKKHECGCNYRKKPVYAVTEEKIDETYKEVVGEG